MIDTKKAYRQIRDISRAAAQTGRDEAMRSRRNFFTTLAYSAMHRSLSRRGGDFTTEQARALQTLEPDHFYHDSIAALPEGCLEQPTFLGRAYQVWNELIRDAHSWAVSKRGENRHEEIDIAAVTQVFTDQYMADFLVSRSIDLWCTSPGREELVPRVCDPALGAGHMLISTVRELAARGVSVNSVAERLFGYDIDPLAVFVARAAVFCEFVRSGYGEDPASLWDKLDRNLKVLPVPYGSLDRTSGLVEEHACFDIIITNPPYLGRRKLPSILRDFLDREYPATSVDLCAAFLQRCLEILCAGGLLGVVTSDKWIRLQRYTTVREGGDNFKGLFGELTINSICELGDRAFSGSSDLHDGMRAALLVGVKASPPPGHQLDYMTFSDAASCEEKQKALTASIIEEGRNSQYVTRIRQSELAKGGAVFLKLNGLPSQFSKMLRRVSDHADVVVGVQTNDDAKYVKYVWQVQRDQRGWRVHSKGGGYGRWAGLNRWVIDWREGGDGFFARSSVQERAESWAAQEGWVYSWLANGSLGLRRKEAGWTFGRAASGGVFTRDQRVVAFMNSRLASAVVRSIGGKIQLPEGTVKAIPAPVMFEQIDEDLVTSAVQLKQRIVASDPTEALFCPRKMLELDELLLTEALLLVVEGVLEQQVEHCMGLSGEERRSLVGRLGPVAGWYSPTAPLESHPVLERIPQQWRDIVERCLAQSRDISVAGRPRPSAQVLELVSDVRKLDVTMGGHWFLPSTGFVETICRAFQLHPFDAFLTAQDLLIYSGGVGRRVYGDYLAREVVVEALGRLGYRWWSESEVDKGRCREKLSYEEVYQIAEERISEHGRMQVWETCGVRLDTWVRERLVEFSNSYFFGDSPLVFDLNDEGFRSVQRAGV